MASSDEVEEFEIDTKAIFEFLMRNDPDFEPDAFAETIERYLPRSEWLVTHAPIRYNEAATYENLLNQEMGGDFREFLESRSIGAADYGGILGPIQFNAIRAQLRSVFPSRNGTTGWKVVLLGFPALQLVVFALGHHYGDTRSQRIVGEASERLRHVALEHVSAESKERLTDYPAATPADWDDRGLMTKPILSIGGLDISAYDQGAGAKLRHVRNTSAKKEIATFFFRHALPISELNATKVEDEFGPASSEGNYHLALIRRVARELGKVDS